MLSQLQNLHRELEVDQAARPELDIEGTERRLMALDFGAHSRGLAGHLSEVTGHTKHILDHHCGAGLGLAGTEQCARTAQGHVLPGPSVLALIALERLERDDKHTLRAFRPQSRVDLVKRTSGGGDAKCSSDAAREPIEIIIRPERLGTVGYAPLIRRVQVDDVEVR